MEYEYSYTVDDLSKVLDYLDKNYKFIEKYKEQRFIYRNSNHTMARITYKNNEMFLDFKEDKLSDKELIERKESKSIKIDDLESTEDILSFLDYKKDNSMIRYRSIYEGNNIKFEIDEYLEPKKAYVISFEGNKDICDKVNENIKELL